MNIFVQFVLNLHFIFVIQELFDFLNFFDQLIDKKFNGYDPVSGKKR